MQKTRVCIYGLYTYHLLKKSMNGFIGGAEVQQVLLGTELNKHNIDVSFVVFDHGQAKKEIIDGITILKTIPPNYKINNFNSLFKVFSVNWKTLTEIDADTYYCRGFGKYTGFIALFCLLNRRKFVLGMASNKDLEDKFKSMAYFDKISSMIGLKLANYVISQNKEQKELLQNNFKVSSILINNMQRIPKKKLFEINNQKVIWVGSIKPEWKQPELFLKLAQEIPEGKFQMIGGPSSNITFYEDIKKRALDIPNLDFLGQIPYHEIDKYFENASILVNTSSVEGFPNTFIQAWLKSVPVVSINVDPNQIIYNNKLGFHSKSFKQMVKDVQILLNDKNLRDEFGNNARKFSEKEFDINKILNQYIQLFIN